MGSALLAYLYTKAVTLKHNYEAIDTFGAHTEYVVDDLKLRF